MYPQPDGTTLEEGVMLNPDTGINTAYEEVWQDDDVLSTDTSQVCAVLKYENSDGRGLVIKLGNYCQGFIRIGENICVERWQSNGQAIRTVRIGTDELPCQLAIERNFTLGEEIISGDRCWTVVEIA